MTNTFKANVNNNMDFDITKEDVLKIDAVKTSDSKYHILNEGKPYNTEVVHVNFGKKEYTIKVNNSTYAVRISDGLDLFIKEMGFSLGASKHVNQIKAPMPGLLLDVHIKEGQEVKEDDPLVILEAMKMENIILSPRDGIIKSISASKGDTVDKGQLLLEFQ
ncbi:acetyl-CoA carboxylase biotin carboxyl carrier protein subunit [Sungkyunkwania multivorans]|uniref:Acetyl-CoA carboxylase biotin carboxyl carrier protein subunit n=1 Tax=Sungkyunkwania multivorans TaxID=1173618 RepID=A0ABW3CYM3_9FLAO